MFECGVIDESELAVEAHGAQQNGAILGNGCALFLCKFIGKLIVGYEEGCANTGHEDEDSICAESYKAALTNTLKECAAEDLKEHGRLLCMKEILCDIAEDKRLDE